jgi:hypothetical protein
MSPRFRFTVGSEPDYEDLVGDLYFDDQIVCVLTQEAGFEAMQIEIHPPHEGRTWTFSLSDFDSALYALKQRMGELRRTDTDDGQRQ